MAKRFLKPSINWPELQKRVPPEEMAKFLIFKHKSESYLARVMANPPEPPKINWDEYKKVVPVQGLVDKLKSAYSSFKVPYPEDKMSAQVEKQWQSLQGDIEKFKKEQEAYIDKATKELKKLEAMPKLEEITMEMFYDMYPDQALDPVKRPTFWPHTPEEQEGYTPKVVVAKKAH